MTAHELYGKLLSLGVYLTLNKDELSRLPRWPGAMTRELQAEIDAHASALVAFMRSEVADRSREMRKQIPALPKSKHEKFPTIPRLVYRPGIMAAEGMCYSCGEWPGMPWKQPKPQCWFCWWATNREMEAEQERRRRLRNVRD
jgi:hypothetical protein